MALHPHSLELVEFPRVVGALAARATSPRASAALASAKPIANAARREQACARMSEAIRRQQEPGAWCFAAPSSLAGGPRPVLCTGTPDPSSTRPPDSYPGVPRGASAGEARDPLDPEAFAMVSDWLLAGAQTREAWAGDGAEELAERFPKLAALAARVPDLDALRERIALTLDADGRVRDKASSALARARRGILEGERVIQRQLERWAAAHGAESYVTRVGERFVALVPASSGARKSAIVHDTSNSGQSLFVEPFDACESNNRLIELRAEAAEEERRILRELSAAVRAESPALELLEDTLATLDALRAAAVWAVELGGVAIAPGGATLRLVRARHPLLAMAARRAAQPGAPPPESTPTLGGRDTRAGGAQGSNVAQSSSVVPLDLELGDDGRVLLVSGPNMGGKTVLLKTVGLAAALAHAGLPVLAGEGSAVPELRELIADLGDEQSVDRGLSTFAAHLLALKAMVEAAGPDVLLLADELGAGTDPEEGAALGRVFVEHLAARGAWAVLTTHLGSLKRVAGEVPGVVNGSLEFDLEAMVSRFRFRRGVPGASHALDVAQRLGFPEALLQRARSLTPPETRALERLLADMGTALTRTNEEREALSHAREAAERAEAEHHEASEYAKRSLAELRRRLTAESEALLARSRELWQTVQREARKREKSRAEAEALRDSIARVEEGASALQAAASPAALGLPEPAGPAAPPSLAPGTLVRISDLGFDAIVVSGPDDAGKVQLRKGALGILSHVSKLRAAEGAAARVSKGPAVHYEASNDAPPLEADLRGLEVVDAISAVDQALDRAVVAGLHQVRLIHGIGTGALRAAVQKHLKGHPQVESHRWGEGHEGGRGVTVAMLR